MNAHKTRKHRRCVNMHLKARHFFKANATAGAVGSRWCGALHLLILFYVDLWCLPLSSSCTFISFFFAVSLCFLFYCKSSAIISRPYCKPRQACISVVGNKKKEKSNTINRPLFVLSFLSRSRVRFTQSLIIILKILLAIYHASATDSLTAAASSVAEDWPILPVRVQYAGDVLI